MAAQENIIAKATVNSNACNVICTHILGAIHFINGGSVAGVVSIQALAPSLALFAIHAHEIVAFSQRLVNVRDDVTRRKLVTHHMNSIEHDICPVLEDLLGDMISTIGNPNKTIEEFQGCVGFELPPITMDNTFNVATVVRYAAPIQGVIDNTRLGNVPVCIDAVASNVLKMINTLMYVTQYSKSYHAILIDAEARCEALTVQRVGLSAYSQILFNNLPADLWVCMKLSADTLVTMARLIQSSTQTWQREVIAIVYELYEFPRMPGSGNDENMQNEYLAALIEDMISKRYGTDKINNPTSDQKTPFMYLTLISMRIQRTMRQLFSGSINITENVFPVEWSNISAVPPYSLDDIFNVQQCSALILESSHHTRSCMIARSSEGFIVLDAATNNLVETAHSTKLDACVFDIMKSVLWRAQFIHLCDNADDVSLCSERTMHCLLAEANLRIFPVNSLRDNAS